jgi:hypothetical protein
MAPAPTRTPPPPSPRTPGPGRRGADRAEQPGRARPATADRSSAPGSSPHCHRPDADQGGHAATLRSRAPSSSQSRDPPGSCTGPTRSSKDRLDEWPTPARAAAAVATSSKRSGTRRPTRARRSPGTRSSRSPSCSVATALPPAPRSGSEFLLEGRDLVTERERRLGRRRSTPAITSSNSARSRLSSTRAGSERPCGGGCDFDGSGHNKGTGHRAPRLQLERVFRLASGGGRSPLIGRPKMQLGNPPSRGAMVRATRLEHIRQTGRLLRNEPGAGVAARALRRAADQLAPAGCGRLPVSREHLFRTAEAAANGWFLPAPGAAGARRAVDRGMVLVPRGRVPAGTRRSSV